MSKIVIFLAPTHLMHEVYDYKNILDFVTEHLIEYKKTCSFEYHRSGEVGADEAFDLTNNPSREYERATKYGSYRSVSVGDVIMVDDVSYVCCSFGWKIL